MTCSFHWGHYLPCISEQRSNRRVNKTNIPNSVIHLHLCILSFSSKKYKYTFSFKKMSFLSWPNFICGGMSYSNKLKEEILYLKVPWPLFFSLQSVARIDPALKFIFVRRISCCEHNYYFQRFSYNLGQSWLLSNKNLIQGLPALPPTLQILPHKLSITGTHASQTNSSPVAPGGAGSCPPTPRISAPSSESGRSGGGEGSWPGAQHMLSNVFRISLALNKSLALRNLSKKELKPPEIPHSRLWTFLISLNASLS